MKMLLAEILDFESFLVLMEITYKIFDAEIARGIPQHHSKTL